VSLIVKTSTRLIATTAASILGVALAVGGAYAATGSLTVSDAPGHVLEVDGVGPASAHASLTAKAHANSNARGLFGTSVEADSDTTADTDGTDETESDQGVSTDTVTPAPPSVVAKDASTVKGNETGKQIEAWAHAKGQVETVAPDAAVSLEVKADASAELGD
jgi:hypothetical protein